MFTWIPIYKELANTLLDYRNRQGELISFLKTLAEDKLPTLKLTTTAAGNREVNIDEIDPFTFFACFNKSLTDANRRGILEKIKRHFKLSSLIPNDFAGIPTLHPMMACFFPYKIDQEPDDISSLWDLSKNVVKYSIASMSGQVFDRCSHIKSVGIPKLTMGMFWLRPSEYLACDKRNLVYIEKRGINVNIKDFGTYKSLVEQVKSTFKESLPELSRLANDEFSPDKKKKPRGSKDEEKGSKSTKPPALLKTTPLNLVLYGPPGTGKTYIAIEKAVNICDGSVPDNRIALVNRFKELQEDSRIEFVTFHQSFGYEEFVEGIRPLLFEDLEGDEQQDLQYEIRDGIFKKICMMAKGGTLLSNRKHTSSIEDSQIWKVSLGDTRYEEGDYVYQTAIEEGRIVIGYGYDLNYTSCDSKEAISRKLDSEYEDYPKSEVYSIHVLKNLIQNGDLVIVSDGNTKFRAIGKITGDYFFERSSRGDGYSQSRPVEWLIAFDESQPVGKMLTKRFSQRTIYNIKNKHIKKDSLSKLLTSKPGPPSVEKSVLIIDEINRGNISKIMGELITLLEPDKRIGAKNELFATLPYSGDPFGVPQNLYIIGTMNTADRSIAFMDTALRRRFVFEEMMPDSNVTRKLVGDNGEVNSIDVADLLEKINLRIEYLYDRDHQIGHSYFLDVKSLTDLKYVFLERVIPLLQEYFYGDWRKLCFVLGCPYSPNGETSDGSRIVISKKIKVDYTDETLVDDYEEYYRCFINPHFINGKEDDLKPYFRAIIDPKTAKKGVKD